MRSKRFQIRFTSLLSLLIHGCYKTDLMSLESESLYYDVAAENLGKNLVWIQDEEDGKCLGPFGFGECGDLNIWEIWGSEGKYNLEHYTMGLDVNSGRCLGRLPALGAVSKLGLESCNNPSALWDFSYALGQLSNGKRFRRCIFRDGNNAFAQSCQDGYTSLTPILHDFQTYQSPPPSSSPSEYISLNQEPDQDSGEWTCPHTGLILPRNLNDRLGESQENRQMFMGGGTFLQTVFNMQFKVYTVAMYIEVMKVSSSELFKDYKNMNTQQLSKSEEFYKVLSSPADFDRSLLIKLAMSLKKETLVNGLVHEMYMDPKNAELVAQSSRKYSSEECQRGMELLVTWRASKPIPYTQTVTETTTNASANPCNKTTLEQLEIRLDGVLVDTLTQPGLAQDLFTQFVSDDPVSEEAKLRFVDGFPALFDGKFTGTSRSRDTKRTGPAPSLASTAAPSDRNQQPSRSRGMFDINTFADMEDWSFITESPSPSPSPSNHNNNNNHDPAASRISIKSRLFRKFSQDRFIQIKNSLAKEMFLTALVLFYCCLLLQLSLPSVTMRIRYVKKRVVNAVKMIRSKSTDAISRMVQSRRVSTGSLSSQYRLIV